MYRKIVEKSRSAGAGTGAGMGKPAVRRLDVFLLLSMLVLAAFGIAKLSLSHYPGSPRRAVLYISPQCEDIFGREAVENLLREFEKQSPELQIRTAGGSPADASPADIVFFDEAQFGALVGDGTLLSLAPYLHTETETGQWAVPLVSFMDLFFYNIDILKAAKFDRPPKTRLEVLLYARAASNRDKGVFGMGLGLRPDDPAALRRELYPWVWAAGGDIRPAESGSRNEVPRTAADIIAFFAQMKAESLLAPGAFEKTFQERLEEFAQGKTAMLTASARELPLLKKRMGASLGVTAVPGAAVVGKNRAGLSSVYAGISAACARPDDAWAFVAFLAAQSPALSAALEAVPGTQGGAFPGIGANSGAIPAAYITAEPHLAKVWEIFESSDIVDTSPGIPQEMEQLLREKLSAVLE